MVTTSEPVRLQATQRDEAGSVLARAFHTNPGFVWALPEEASRPKKLTWFMRAAVKVGLEYGEVYTSPAGLEGAAIWLPPGGTNLSVFQLLRVGFMGGLFVWGIGPFMKSVNVMNRFEHHHKEAMPADHWYLFVIGVDPPRQGQGVGSSLMAPVLRRADDAHLPCYLETDKPEDVVFYEKHGFEVVVKDRFAADGPDFWTMRRPAR